MGGCRKGASRLAAEERFELIRGRVEGRGGARAWRESRRRQREGFHSDGEEEGQRKEGDEHEKGKGEGLNEDEDEDRGYEGEEEESEELVGCCRPGGIAVS